MRTSLRRILLCQRTLSLLLVISCSFFGCTPDEPTPWELQQESGRLFSKTTLKTKPPEPEYLSEPEILDMVSRFYVEALGLNPTRVNLSSGDRVARLSRSGSMFVWHENAVQSTVVEIDRIDGFVHTYFNEMAFRENQPGERSGVLEAGLNVPSGDEATATAIFEIAKPILGYFGLPVDFFEYEVLAPSEIDMQTKRRGGFSHVYRGHDNIWAVARDFDYNGVPYSGKFFTMFISGVTRRVISIRHKPILLFPEPVETNITQSEAWELVVARKEAEGDFDVEGVENPTDSISMKIVERLSPVQDLKEDLFGPKRKPSRGPHYYWVVPYKYHAQKTLWTPAGVEVATMYVDVETGDLYRTRSYF